MSSREARLKPPMKLTSRSREARIASLMKLAKVKTQATKQAS